MGRRGILIIRAIHAKAANRIQRLGWLLLALSLGGCGAKEPLVAEANAVGAHLCADPSAAMEVTFYGPDERSIQWSGAQLRCAGMSRPTGQGVRLRFSHADPEEPLAIVMGLGNVIPGKETPANITLILEDNGRFFSSVKADNCRARVDAYEVLPATAPAKRIIGLAWCVSPLREVNGEGEITLGDIEFTGFIPWPPAKPESAP
jgi:hypothetical protein